MLIYRVENRDNKGPYTCGNESIRRALWSHQRCDNHPAPRNDGIPYEVLGSWRTTRYHFGFRALDQLCAWFATDERALLEAEGFSLALYEVDEVHVHIGGRQVAFNRAHAAIVTVKPLSTINTTED